MCVYVCACVRACVRACVYACVRACVHAYVRGVVCVCLCITPPHGQPHAIFGGSISGGRMLLCTEFITAEARPHITVHYITTFWCSFGPLACHCVVTQPQLWHGVLADVSVL